MTRSLFASLPLAGLAVLAALLAAIVALVARRRTASRAEALVAPDLGRRAGLLPATSNGALALSLGALAVLGIGLALARPRWGRTTETLVRRGADVVILLDTSASMRAADVTPSRFVLAQKAALSLLARMGGDRVALVATEGEAQVLSPLTLDAAAVALFLDSLEPGIGARPGTSLAAGLNAAVELYAAGPGSGKHCVVLSDGEDLEGGVEAAIEKAKGEGIVVHTVFVGASAKGAPVPEVDAAGRATGYKTDSSGAPILSRPDPELLKKLAAETGGTFSTVSPGKTDLEGVALAIDRKQRGGESETVATNLEERFQLPLGVAVGATALLLLGAPAWGRSGRGVRAGFGAALAAALALVAPPARSQPASPPGATASAPPAAAPAPVPAPEPSLLDRVLANPPFASARREAEKGKRALEAKNVPEAVARFAREAEIAPEDPAGFYNLGTALSAAGKRDEALASLERARRGGDRAVASDAAFNAGTALFRAGDYEGAAGAFRESLKRSPGREDAAWNWELCVRKAQEEKKKQQQQQKQDQQQQPNPQSGAPTPTPKPKDPRQEFEDKAKMSPDKAEQLLSAIDKSDLEEQKRKIAEQKSKRRVARDW